jgi:putative ABC transport system permease protein
MKAIGFKSRSICAQHSLRFLFVVFISGILAAVLNIPFTTLICDRIFAVMGAISGISYSIKPLEVLLIYPLIICIVVVITAYLTSLYARSIKTQDMGNIE